MKSNAGLFLSCLVFGCVSYLGYAQISNGINLSNRRISPPRIAPPRTQSQPRPQNVQRPAVYNQFAPRPSFFNAAFLANRITNLEGEMRRMSGAMNALSNNLRVAFNNLLGERLMHVQQEIQGNVVRIDGNQENVDRVSQELEYIKNSNANMQKRMDRIEDKQRRQEDSIEDVQRAIENLQQVAGVEPLRKNTTESPSVDNSQLQALSSAVRSLSMRINSTDDIIEGYGSYFQTFATNIDTLSQKTESLHGKSAQTFRTLRQLNQDVRSIEKQVQDLQDNRQKHNHGNLDGLETLQRSISVLRGELRSVEQHQEEQALSIQNLTSLVASEPSNASSEEDAESDMLFNLAYSMGTMEESIKQIRENELIHSGEYDLRFQTLTADTSSNENAIAAIQFRVVAVEALFNSIQGQLEHLNTTVLNGQDLFQNNDISPSESYSTFTLDKSNQKNTSAPVYSSQNMGDFFIDNFVTFDAFNERIRNLENNVTNRKSRKDMEPELKSLRSALDNQNSRLDRMARSITDMEHRSSLSKMNSDVSIDETISQLSTDLQSLNSTLSAQTSMFSQGISALGSYDRRLRDREEQDRLRVEEMGEIRNLLQNATNSLSQMSFSVAQHELIIPGIFESLKTGDDVFIDLSQQVYNHGVALEGLNRTISEALEGRRLDFDGSVFDSSQSNEEGKAPKVQLNRIEKATAEPFATQSELNALADALAGVAARIDNANENYKTLNIRLAQSTTPALRASDIYNLEKTLNELLVRQNLTEEVTEFQGNVISALSFSNDELKQQVVDLFQALSLLEPNETSEFDPGDLGNEFIQLLDASVRELRSDVNEQRKWLGNQRRRIRNLEEISLQPANSQQSISVFNATVSSELGVKDLPPTNPHSVNDSRVTSGGSSLTNVIGSTNDVTRIFSTESNSDTVEQLQQQLAVITERLNSYKPYNANKSIADQLVEDGSLMDSLKTVPVALRILETQVQSLQETLLTIPELRARVETLQSMRNLLFQNAASITTFHQSVADLEIEVGSVNRKLASVEFSNKRLDAYQDDLRAKVNFTRRSLDRTNDRVVAVARILSSVDRYLLGNSTEIKDKIIRLEGKFDDNEGKLAVLKRRTDNLEQDFNHQASADLIRHNGLDVRIARDERRLADLEELTLNSDVMVTNLTRSILDETNSRMNALAEHSNQLSSIHESVSRLQQWSTSGRESIAQTTKQLDAIIETQATTSAEVSSLQSLYQTAQSRIQESSTALGRVRSQIEINNDRINNIDDDITELGDSLTAQGNHVLSVRQSLTTVNDQVNSLQQNSQQHGAFMRRAEQMIDKHRSDIAFILEHSSNHSVAIERLKQQTDDSPQESYSNITQEMLQDIQVLDYTLRSITEELNLLKMQSYTKGVQVETRITQLAASATELSTKITKNRNSIERTRSDVNRYSDRVRTLENDVQEQRVARNDLQQVVISNRNKLTALDDIRSEMNGIRSDQSKSFSVQENRTRSLHHSYNILDSKISGINVLVTNHKNILQILRQDRISLESSIDQIIQSSSNLEELLRTTVTNLARLKRDFDASVDSVKRIPDLQSRTSQMQSDIHDITLTTTANENKIERFQEQIKQMSGSINTLASSLQNHMNSERSREHSQSGEIREVRNILSRSSASVQTIQRELHSHNQRLHHLNQRIIDFDSRYSTFFSQTSPVSNVDTSSSSQNYLKSAENEEMFAASSGWTEPATTASSSRATNSTVNNIFYPDDVIGLLSERLSELSNKFDLVVGKLGENDWNLDNRKTHKYTKMNVRMSENSTTLEAIALLKERIDMLSDDITGYDVTRLDEMTSNLTELSKKANAAESASLAALSSNQRTEELCNYTTRYLNITMLQLKQTLSESIMFQADKIFNLTSVVINIADDAHDIRLRLNDKENIDDTRNDLNSITEALNNLETNVESLILDLGNVTSAMSKYEQQMTSNPLGGALSNMKTEKGRLSATMHDQNKVLLGNLSQEVWRLSENFDMTSNTISTLQQNVEHFQDKILNKGPKNHSHSRIDKDIQLTREFLWDFRKQLKELNNRSVALERQHMTAFNLLNELTLANKMRIDNLSTLITNQNDLQNVQGLSLQSTKQNLMTVQKQVVALSSNINEQNSQKHFSKLFENIVGHLEAFNQSVQAVIDRASLLNVYDGLSKSSVESEASVEKSLEESSNPLPDVYDNDGVEDVIPDYFDSTETQVTLKQTNQNLAVLASQLVLTLRQYSQEFSSEVKSTNESKVSDEVIPSPEHSSQLYSINVTLQGLVNRVNEMEEGRMCKVQKLIELNVPRLTSAPSGLIHLTSLRPLQNDVLDLLLFNMTSLSEQINSCSREKVTLLENNQQNFSRFFHKKAEEFNSDLFKSKSDIKQIRNILSMLNSTVWEYAQANKVQDQSIQSMIFTQEAQSRNIRKLQTLSEDLSFSFENATSHFHLQLLNTDNRLTKRLDRFSADLPNVLNSIRFDVIKATDDVTFFNFSLNSVKEAITKIQEDLHLQTSNVDLISILQSTVDQNGVMLSNLQNIQQQEQSELGRFEQILSNLSDQLFMFTDDVNNLNSDIEWTKNQTKDLVDVSLQRIVGAEERLRQEVTLVADQVNVIEDGVTTTVEDATNQLRQDFMQLQLKINASLRNGESNLVSLQRETERLVAAKQNNERSLLRHTTELKGLSRAIQTSEDLLRALAETVTLNGNQINLLTGEVLQDGDNAGHAISFLSSTISNHSARIDSIEDQISLLLNRVKNPTSVRIVVPPSGSLPNRAKSATTTQASTTIRPIFIPAPTNLEIISVNSHQLVVTWKPPRFANIVEYRIMVQNTADLRDLLQIAAVGPPVTVNNLFPSTRYRITVHSVLSQQLSAPISVNVETNPVSTSPPSTTTTVSTTAATTTTPTTVDRNAINPVDNYLPRNNPAETSVLYCNFDNDSICGFLDDTNGDFDWTRHNGSTPSSDTGPSRDHTLGSDSGFYMFIEASRPRQVGDIARLFSPLMEATDGQCLEFYYHMYGVGTGDLNVLLDHLDGSVGTRVWSESGNHGNQWKRAKVTIKSNSAFRLVFEAVRGSDYHADSAIDDVIVSNEPCPQPLIKCGFEQVEICGFIQDADDDFNWDRNSGATTSAGTGPIADHTLGTVAGNYLYLESSNPRIAGEVTRLSSPLLGPTTAQCLHFYYHMHGVDIGALNVYIRQQSNPRDLGSPIWTKSGEQGNDWLLGRVSLVSSDSYQVVLEGVRGRDYHGDIAIDDVTITNGICDQPVCSIGVQFEDLCYNVERKEKTYQAASDYCASNGGLLAPIKTQEQQTFLQALLKEEGNQWTLFWIGLDDRIAEGRFMFSDNTPLAIGNNTFGAWALGEPNDTIGDEDCVNLEFATKQRLWNDVPCNRELWFICQYPISL